MIHKVSAKSLKKQMRKENELKGAYNSLSKSSFAKKLFFMKIMGFADRRISSLLSIA